MPEEVSPYKEVSTFDIEEDEGDIYVRTITKPQDKEVFCWFRINLRETVENKFIPSYLPRVEGWGNFSYTAFGSTIYTFGGSIMGPCGFSYTKGKCRVNFIDTISQSDNSKKWLRGISMSHPRIKPYPVRLPDGRILVIGGRTRPPFAEIFDPRTQTWTPTDPSKDPDVDLNPRDFEIKSHRITGNDKVLLHTTSKWQLILYDIEKDSWELYNDNLAKELYSSVFIDDILYVGCMPFKQRYKFLFAYNFENFDSDYKKKKLPATLMPVNLLPPKADIADKFKDLEPRDWIPTVDRAGNMPQGHLLAVGNGKLAVIWGRFVKDDHEHDDGTTEWQMRIRLSVYKMIKKRNKLGALKSLDALPLYHKEYLTPGFLIMDCISVFNSPKMKAREDLNCGGVLFQKRRRRGKGKRKIVKDEGSSSEENA